MSLPEILCYPSKALRLTAKPVTAFDAQLQSTVKTMSELLEALQGWGLSAPEIGIAQRIVILDMATEQTGSLCMINPEILTKEGEALSQEDCLSFMGLTSEVKRAKNITVQYQDLAGAQHTLTLEGAPACGLQHLIDHLEGVLFIDYLSKLKKERLLKKWEKSLEEHAHCGHSCEHEHH